ncbi:putative leucine-rich repeat extensin-like protein 2 [Cocos nucifera]|uniref:Putative leucine-rich repeat extensin-like protein 2 n=1 Tax=Cocos nucifera TaxID=13894 RepID=A0A8K0I3K0_COCNU|nr:putative leucine-rich repeat extensin-like protein 2 [Cocos nucifera]
MEAVPTTASGGGIGYADSVDSSPRSRGGESWDEPIPSSAAAASRLRLMCSYGGRIVPRPTDRSLCYLGGETRIVVVDRHSSLADLSAKLSRSLLGGRSFSLKYQLPNEDLDSLISVTTDEDLDNMIEEYDRILQSSSAGAAAPGGGGGNTGNSRSNRLRLFLFPSNPDSASSSIGSLLDDSKSENWFVDALNSAMGVGIDGLSADSASVNCLLGLEDDSSTHSRGAGVGAGASSGGPGGGAASEPEQLILPRRDSSGKLARHGQDVHSVPDSPMLDTTSSFGSTSSAPSLSHLPPIRVRPEDRPPDQRIGGLEDHFGHMNLSSAAAAVSGQRPDEGYKDSNFPPHYPPPPPIPVPTGSSSTPTISPTENSSRVFSDDEKSDHGGVRKPLPPPQPKPTPIDASVSDSTARFLLS